MKVPENQRTEFPMISPPKTNTESHGDLPQSLSLSFLAGRWVLQRFMWVFAFNHGNLQTSFSDEPKQRQSMEQSQRFASYKKNRWPTWEFAPLENSRWNIQIIKSLKKKHPVKITEFQGEIPIPAKWVLNIFPFFHFLPKSALARLTFDFMDQIFKHSTISRYIDTLPPQKKNRENFPPLPREKSPAASFVSFFFRGGESQRAHKPLKRGSVS